MAVCGCGADREPAQAPATSTQSPGSTSAESTTQTTTTESDTTETDTTETDTGRSSPEAEQGGAGDERPVRSAVRIEGSGGRLAPTRVEVAPFIAVRVELRSTDGGRYRARVGGRTLVAAGDGGGERRDRVMLEGLTPDRSYVLRGLDGANDVRIVASGEPSG